MTSGIVFPDDLSVDHWINNITHPVCFVEAFESICFNKAASTFRAHTITNSVDVIIEIGPHSTL